MKKQKKEELSLLLKKEVETGQAAGVQAMVYHKGQEVYYDAYGMADMERQIPMERNTICRIYSMTKPITAIAAMILQERGLLNLEKEVADYLPEFATMFVAKKAERIPAERKIKIADLLTMTSGIVYPDSDAAGLRMNGLFLEIQDAIQKGNGSTTQEVIRKIADCPLGSQPGERWRYGLSADVLAAVIEVVSKQTLGEFFQKEIFEPLEMTDTAFFVPKEKKNRFAELYQRTDEQILTIDRFRHLGLTFGDCPPAYESGGAGLYSTISDYSHVTQMLLNGGIYKGKRILAEKTVEFFTQNQLPDELISTISFSQMQGYGYSSLMRVKLKDGTNGVGGSRGEFGWDGWTGPYFSVDREKQLSILYMVQVSDYNHWDFIWKLRDIVYSAIEHAKE